MQVLAYITTGPRVGRMIASPMPARLGLGGARLTGWNMQAEPEIVRLLVAYQDIWFAHFNALSKRADWHIIGHLCARGRTGCAAGELNGLAKQLFLLDDTTVKERLLTLRALGFCTLCPDQPVTARTLVVPTNRLHQRFDAHLRDFAAQLSRTRVALGLPPQRPLPETLAPTQREALLAPLYDYGQHYAAALGRLFDKTGLTPGRAQEARRHMNAPSHWNLVHQALLHHDPNATGGAMADQLAAVLLRLTGQSLQTSRDHIGQLLAIGIFNRLPGRTLRVTLAPAAAAELRQALRHFAASLQDGADDGTDDPETAEPTVALRPAPATAPARHVLLLSGPDLAGQTIEVRGPTSIGRTGQNDLILRDASVSRSHCRLLEEDGRLMIIDTGSTNGTAVNGCLLEGPAALGHGDTITVGCYCLTYQDHAVLYPGAVPQLAVS